MDANLLNLMPVEASTWAARVDELNAFITIVAALCTVAITAVMLYFAWKYRRRGDDDQTAYITHNATIETIWTVVPTIICLFVFIAGFKVYREMRTPPANPLEISVTGRKWAWSFKYPNGKTSDQELVVPVGRPVKLITRSLDVNHSFFLPEMRVKEDVIASEYHYLWFNATQTGEFHIFCAEYCGREHSGMLGKLRVVPETEYQDYVNDRVAEQLPPDQLGMKLYDTKGCKQCHSVDGSKVVGPSFKGLFGRSEALADGSSVQVDENYLSESMREPAKKVVATFPPAMPVIPLKDEEIDGLIAYIKTLK